MYKVVQWATGSVGRTALRRVIDHPDLKLVGLYVYSPDKAGRDAGHIARRDPTGVMATNRIDDILALDADVVLHTSLLNVPYAAQNADVERLLAAGKNVISVNGYFMPHIHGPAYAAPLLDATRQGNSTLAGIGINPGFIAERIALTLTGMMAQLESIECREMADSSHIPNPGFVFDVMGFGADPAKNDITQGPLASLYRDLFSETFAYVAESLGTTVATLSPAHRLTLAPHDMQIAAGTVRKGTVAATEWRWDAQFADGRHMTHSVLWTSDPALHGDRDAAHWKVKVNGRPNISLQFKVEDPNPAAPPLKGAMDALAALMVQAIPDVCAAPAGFYRLPAVLPYRERLQDRPQGRT